MTPLQDALRFEPHPEAWLLVVALVGGYRYLLAAWGPRFVPHRRGRWASRQHHALFYCGVAALWIGSDWPVHGLAEDYLYSVHMLQHMLYQLVAAPLLILGVPAWLWRALLRPPWLQHLVRRLMKPLVAIVIVNTFVAVAHTTWWVELSVTNGLFHFASHLVWIGVGVLMWWPVLSPLPELPHYSYLGRLVYLFSHSLTPTVPASFLTFTSAALYPSYAAAPRLSEFLTPVHDLRIAGLLMKIGSGLLLWGVIAWLWFKWSSEDASGGPDFLYWREHDASDDLSELVTR